MKNIKHNYLINDELVHKESYEIVKDYFRIIEDYYVREYSSIPTVLFHYTSIDTFFNVINSKNIWMSNIAYQNDSQEINDGVKIIKNILNYFLLNEKNNKVKKYLSNIVDEIGNLSKLSSYYTFSLSTKKDQLSQWRGYSKNNGGISIGFAKKNLIKNLLRDVYVLPVIYNNNIKKKLVKKIIEGIVNTYRLGINKKIDPNVFISAMARFDERLKELIIIFKNEAFEEENEWRFVVQPNHLRNKKKYEVKFRVKSNVIIPYIEYPIFESNYETLKEIVIGPSVTDLSIMSLHNYIESKGLKRSVNIEFSQIPYRII